MSIGSVNINSIKTGVGIAGAGKYIYQSARVMNGLGSSTPLTVALDIASGTTGIGAANSATAVVKASTSLAKGINGCAKISHLGKISQFAAKASPIIAKGSSVISAAIGGVEVGKGIHDIRKGDKAKGTERVVTGGTDIITAAALYAAAGNSAMVGGVPVAGIALAIAGVSQAGKFAFKFRHQIGNAAKAAGHGIANGAKAAGHGIATGAKAVGHQAQKVGQAAATKASQAHEVLGNGVNKVAQGACKILENGKTKLQAIFSEDESKTPKS